MTMKHRAKLGGGGKGAIEQNWGPSPGPRLEPMSASKINPTFSENM